MVVASFVALTAELRSAPASVSVRQISAATGSGSDGGSTGDDPAAEPAVRKPNVVLIVADDLDTQLLPYLPNVRRLIGDEGATFSRFYVEQSTCCTSRATILSGQYVHNHHVEANAWPLGGFERWKQGRESTALPTWLQAVGWRTALMGKYLNEYPSPRGFEPENREASRQYVPPGWDDWMVPVKGNAYAQVKYQLNVDGEVQPFSTDYLDSVLGEHLTSLVDGAAGSDAAGSGSGFDLAAGGNLLYYASYSPHSPYAHPAELDDQFTDVTYPRGASFDEADISDKLGMTRARPRISAAYAAEIDETFRDRIRSVQVLDRNVGELIEVLEQTGSLDNTYVMFTSDNGYTMGEHRRLIGKYNQFEETVRVPLMVRGPGITPGTVIDDVAGNADLAPTIAAIAGARAPYAVDGVDLLPLLTGKIDTLDREGYLLGRALIPSYRTAPQPIDEVPEDFVADDRINRLNDYTGVVTQRWKLVRYTHQPLEELYDLVADPHELTNLLPDGGAASYAALPRATRTELDRLRLLLDRLNSCAGENCH